MAQQNLRARIQKGVFVLDGAMGTQLFARGVEPGHCNDWLNVEQPDLVLDVHKAYIDAGSDAILTNTFGANRFALGRHGYADKAFEINKAGAQVARKAAGQGRYVLGDIGPTGDFLQPLGMLKPDEVREAFVEQVKGLREGGVDGLIIETMTAIDELEVAIDAAKSAGGGLPLFASMSYDKGAAGFRTMMGVDVATAGLEDGRPRRGRRRLQLRHDHARRICGAVKDLCSGGQGQGPGLRRAQRRQAGAGGWPGGLQSDAGGIRGGLSKDPRHRHPHPRRLLRLHAATHRRRRRDAEVLGIAEQVTRSAHLIGV